MSSAEIDLMLRHRPFAEESIEERHKSFVDKMNRIGPPLGFEGLPLPPFKSSDKEWIDWWEVRYPIRGLKMAATYNNRRNVSDDKATNDDDITFRFKTSNKSLNYTEILHEHFPAIIAAYGGYLARDWFDDYSMRYEKNNSLYQQLKQEDSSQLDSRKFIFTLHPAIYWDRLLCERALGYGPDEVVSLLSGLVPQVRMLNDGVYTVFNDDKDLPFADFVAFNDRFKPILGLI